MIFSSTYRTESQSVYLLVDSQVLLDIGVGSRQIGLWLVVVIIADIILHRILWEEAPHFLIQLGGQRLVVRQDEHGFTYVGNDVGNGKRLTRTRHAQQHLGLVATTDAVRQLADSFRLVTCRLVL